MKIAIIESPYAGDIPANMTYLRECLKDALSRGEHPYASHAYLPAVLNDADTAERKRGLEAGHAISRQLLVAGYCARLVFCVDRGMSPGMMQSFETLGRVCTFRQILFRSVIQQSEVSVAEVVEACR